ncbi:MAG: Glycosyltransferase [Candidatus Peregrinibacteria bacterium GW2011_GWA2_33_10]|nr:MAG: Glycosyltransferase [Candidatus Peregrinibacteria bacterium GW2011_GWA2_33_10]KKP41249.1 MAG: glycosyltransferase [Candidatus Peregrinibacteria bacterium GW2011_GWC2_33_13]OGJ50333.1 MAG: hypothetical protein A2229_02530 [Candidatus Peregrinibacteria bacterium RIFOXYA2_FULL_33_7]
MKNNPRLKIALVHEYLVKLGGAEKVLAVFAEMFPDAPIFTMLYDEKICGKVFPKERIKVSGLNKLPEFIKNKRRYLFPLMPKTIENFDFSDYDIVISSNSAYCHGIITNSNTFHICYCHSPMRYAWDWYHEYKDEQRVGFFKKMIISYLMKKIRIWDKAASDRPDVYIANSKNVQNRLKKYYRTNSLIIYPPVDINRFKVQKTHEDYFLIVSTLTPYKKIDLAIKLFNKIGKKLIIIGSGNEMQYLKNISENNIEFLGYKNDQEVSEYMQNCRALIFPGEEDFGIAPIEAQACGKPVLGLEKGGLKETIISGKTGELFSEPTIESMENALAKLIDNEKFYDTELMRKNAERFGKEVFVERIRDIIKSVIRKP